MNTINTMDIFHLPADGGMNIKDLRKAVKERWDINPYYTNGNQKDRKQLYKEVEQKLEITGKITVDSFPHHKIGELIRSFKQIKEKNNAKYIRWIQNEDRGQSSLVSGEIIFSGRSKRDVPNIRISIEKRLKLLRQAPNKIILWTILRMPNRWIVNNIKKDLIHIAEELKIELGSKNEIDIELDIIDDYMNGDRSVRIVIINEDQVSLDHLSRLLENYFWEKKNEFLFNFQPEIIDWGCRNPHKHGTFSVDCSIPDSEGRCLNEMGRSRYKKYKDICGKDGDGDPAQQYHNYLECYKARRDFEGNCVNKVDKGHMMAWEYNRLKALELAETLGISPDPVLLDTETVELINAPCVAPRPKNLYNGKCSKTNSEGRCRNTYAMDLGNKIGKYCHTNLLSTKRKCFTNPNVAHEDYSMCDRARKKYRKECINKEDSNDDKQDSLFDLCQKYHHHLILLQELLKQMKISFASDLSAYQIQFLGEILVIYLIDYGYDIPKAIKLADRQYITEFGISLHKANKSAIEKLLNDLIKI